jgi:hypothetical protein
MLSAKKAGQRTLIVSGGDRILSDIEKLWIFTFVKMRFGMFEVKYQPSVLWGPIPFQGLWRPEKRRAKIGRYVVVLGVRYYVQQCRRC